jgi:universal stress protein G|tara:strand:+ start:2593 stop:3027 length:435 start_codon:yes stop_codon:yes gene_type:complete
MYRNILVPLDVSDPQNADAALSHAAFLARASGAMLHLLHVRMQLPKTYARYLPEGWDAEDTSECRDWLNSRREQVNLPQDRSTVHLRRGSVSGETLSLAVRIAADLIIIGSHMPSMSTRILGSNATAIVRDAQVSVLVVRCADE